MRDRSLIERLRRARTPGGVRAQLDPNELADSVLEHLRRMLNTRQGMACTAPDYGVPDLATLASQMPEAIEGVRRSIRSSIEKYEPRLRKPVEVNLQESDDPFQLTFEIRAQMVVDRDRSPVTFYTTLHPSGEASVRR